MLIEYSWLTPSIRFALSFLASLALTVATMPFYIRFIIKKTGTQSISEYLKKTGDHGKKTNTPTTGGLIIALSSILTSIITGQPTNKLYQIVILTGVLYGFLGLIDDLAKIKKRTNKGLLIKPRLFVEFSIAGMSLFLIHIVMDGNFSMDYVFVKSFTIKAGVLCFLMQLCTIVGSSNAVNMTDGLDGLVSVPASVCFIFFACFISKMPEIYSNSAITASFLQTAEEINIASIIPLCGAIFGSLMGFLWFNIKPAKIFMGDVGSLFIGSIIGTISVITKSEPFLFLVGGLFVWETLSVVIQLTSLKMRGSRVFLMAPIHHHYEIKGWQETQVVVRFWIISIILGVFGICLAF